MKSLGQIGEEIACQYLKERGYKILERNYKKNWGEIDIIGQKDKKIIFFEVKCLKSKRIFPEQKITQAKIKKISRTAQFYINLNHLQEGWQIDLIAIDFQTRNKCRLRHLKNIA